MSKQTVKKPMSILDFFKRKQDTTITRAISSEKTEKCPVCNAIVYVESQSIQVHVNSCLDAQSTSLVEETSVSITENIKTNNETNLSVKENTITSHSTDNHSSDNNPIDNNASKKRKLPAPKSQKASTNNKKKKPCPFYKWMKDTPFVVDAFNYGKIDNCAGYFLSHFHYDHYGGLTKNWSHGPIYCSKVTANLVKQQLKVDAHWLRPLPMDEFTDITDNIKVALIDANHCPGSVLFLFVINNSKRHLHTGDFRASPKMCLHPLIRQPENPPISCLYLDTTYMNPMYAFPAQEECIQAVCDVIKKDMNNIKPVATGHSNSLDTWIKKVITGNSSNSSSKQQDEKGKSTLIIVGTYTIGKEKVFVNAAKMLDSKIYVNNKKKQILLCQENQELNKRLTDQPNEAQVHVVPLSDIRYDKLATYLEQYKSYFSNIIAIKPTGWAYKPTQSQYAEMRQAPLEQIIQPPENAFTLSQMNNSYKIKIYNVPYSEHSSFRELASFIASLNIDTILPTVNLSKTKEMQTYFESWKYEKQAKKIEVVPFITEDHW